MKRGPIYINCDAIFDGILVGLALIALSGLLDFMK